MFWRFSNGYEEPPSYLYFKDKTVLDGEIAGCHDTVAT